MYKRKKEKTGKTRYAFHFSTTANRTSSKPPPPLPLSPSIPLSTSCRTLVDFKFIDGVSKGNERAGWSLKSNDTTRRAVSVTRSIKFYEEDTQSDSEKRLTTDEDTRFREFLTKVRTIEIINYNSLFVLESSYVLTI